MLSVSQPYAFMQCHSAESRIAKCWCAECLNAGYTD
jgi:hypothetical protein